MVNLEDFLSGAVCDAVQDQPAGHSNTERGHDFGTRVRESSAYLTGNGNRQPPQFGSEPGPFNGSHECCAGAKTVSVTSAALVPRQFRSAL